MTATNPVMDPLGLLTSLAKSAAAAVAGLALTVVVGLLSLTGPVKSVDGAVIDAAVPGLQSIPGLASLSERLTDLGAIPVNYGMALALTLVVALQRRHLYPASLVIGCLVGAHAFQNVTNRIVEGTVPATDVIGAAGPYFSGGVMRVILLAGVTATVILPPSDDRWVWRLAISLGVLEALTRFVLGRHWPFDLVAAFPVGLGLLWIFRSLYAPWRSRSYLG